MSLSEEKLIIIRDPLIEPFRIEVDNWGYHVYRQYPTSPKKFCGSHNKLGDCINQIIIRKTKSHESEYSSIKEYAERVEKLKKEIIDKLNF